MLLLSHLLFVWRLGTALACVIEAYQGQSVRCTMTCIMVGMLVTVTSTAYIFLIQRYP